MSYQHSSGNLLSEFYWQLIMGEKGQNNWGRLKKYVGKKARTPKQIGVCGKKYLLKLRFDLYLRNYSFLCQ